MPNLVRIGDVDRVVMVPILKMQLVYSVAVSRPQRLLQKKKVKRKKWEKASFQHFPCSSFFTLESLFSLSLSRLNIRAVSGEEREQ